MTRLNIYIAALLVGGLIGYPRADAAPLQPDVGRASATESTASIELAQNVPGQPASQPPATDAAQTADPIGNVATLTGTATVTRNKVATALKLKDDIFQNDLLQTAANSTLGVTFNDETTFNLTANASINVDAYIYEEGGGKNAALFNIAKGTVAFVASAVARTGDMKISTPTATLGIRGTTGLVEVPEGAAAANPNNVNIKLYPDPDGRVGHIEVNGRDGTRLGTLSQGASGFTVRPGAGGRFTAVALSISPQQAARDQGIVRQVHAAQAVGRQVVIQRRNEIRNNRLRNNPPARQPGQPQQNGAPRQNGQLPPNGTPKPNGTPGQPAQPAQPAQPVQPGLQRQGAPQLQRPAGPGRPGLRLPAPPRQKGKPKR